MHVYPTRFLSLVGKFSGVALRVLLFISLLLVLCGISIEFSGSFEASSLPQQYAERTDEGAGRNSTPLLSALHQALAHLPRSPAASLALLNYPEDRAIREALLAGAERWHVDAPAGQTFYHASNNLIVYHDRSLLLESLPGEHVQSVVQSDGTLLTARIVLGLWASRRDHPQLSFNGSALIQPDEILSWRGVQKHQRRAYYGASKRFSDGYPWKQRQQIQQDLASLAHYRLRGQHSIISQGKILSVSVDTPYLSLTPIVKQGKIAAYLVAPGAWLASYEEHQMNFFADVNVQLFQLNPRNDYLALRLGLYLVEHWRRYACGGDEIRTSFCMADLLAASMIPIEKANLTSRFAPRVEAALQKLYDIGVLGEPPLKLTGIDTTRAYWGKAWLTSSWRLVPPQQEM